LLNLGYDYEKRIGDPGDVDGERFLVLGMRHGF
jgi:hypothetical protein